MGWETFRFGQIYLDGEPKRDPTKPTKEGNIPSFQDGQSIDILNSNGDNKIRWIKPNGMNLFIADRVLLNNVSWDDLNHAGFVEGKTICIDGRLYRCRVLQVGSSNNEQNEWDRILDVTTEDNDVWHWNRPFFWGADKIGATGRAFRGYHSARSWYYTLASYRGTGVGFRPALEPLPSKALGTDELITLDGQKFVISQLQGANDRMFYPQLTPIEANSFRDIPNGSIIKMYSTLVDGNPVRMGIDEPVSLPDKVDIHISDKFYGEEFLIPWVISNGIAIAANPVL